MPKIVVANLRNRISMPTDEKLCHVVNEGASLYFLVGGEREFFFSSWCLVWRVDCSLSTWTVHSPLFMQAFCLLVCLFCFVLFCFVSPLGWGRVKAKSPQVPDLFLKMFPLAAPHFYPICFGKCCPPFIYIDGLKGKIAYFIIEPSM